MAKGLFDLNMRGCSSDFNLCLMGILSCNMMFYLVIRHVSMHLVSCYCQLSCILKNTAMLLLSIYGRRHFVEMRSTPRIKCEVSFEWLYRLYHSNSFYILAFLASSRRHSLQDDTKHHSTFYCFYEVDTDLVRFH